MPLIVVKAGTPVIKPGSYPATLIAIAPKRLVSQYTDPPGEEDDFLEWTWLVEGPDKDVEVTSLTSLATGPKSRIFEYLTALSGGEAPAIEAGFEESDLVGKTVMVSTIVDVKGFSKIDTIIAAPTARAATAAPEKKAAPKPKAVREVEAEEAAEVVVEEAVEEVAEDDLPF